MVMLAFVAIGALAQVRTQQTFEKGWKFTREDQPAFSNVGFDDAKWQSVTVPHDWAIYGPFDINNDRQNMAIAQDGQTEEMEHAGRTGGLPFIGVGWYRLEFDAPSFSAGKTATILFDGAMSHARVWLNGHELGYWPYGYNSFHFDVTPYLKATGNTLAVRLENEVESSRWYPGAGLYRNVHLFVTEDAHVPVWGTQLTTPEVNKEYAKVHLITKLDMPTGKSITDYRIVTELRDAAGNVVASAEKQGSRYDGGKAFEQDFVLDRPALWSPDSPSLYTAVSKIYEGNTLKDEYSTRFGVRSIEIIPGKGFFLNGEHTYFRGVCNHHDLGPLGGIANDAGIRRQIRILKDMGCNAIRTSHNMPAPELIRACDEMGMMVMAEPAPQLPQQPQRGDVVRGQRSARPVAWQHRLETGSLLAGHLPPRRPHTPRDAGHGQPRCSCQQQHSSNHGRGRLQLPPAQVPRELRKTAARDNPWQRDCIHHQFARRLQVPCSAPLHAEVSRPPSLVV